jgi:PhnB protein
MKTLNPYINFAGQCREAMAFYKDCFQGEITALQTFGEAGMDVPEPFKQNILHSELKAEAMWLQASDGQPGSAVIIGDNVTLSINLSDEKEQQRIFDTLADGGKVDYPLHDTFWGARFGMVMDRYGLHWQLNCEKKQA